MSFESSPRSSRKRTGAEPQRVQGPFTFQVAGQPISVPYVEVQKLAGRGGRCRAPGIPGFVKCPEQAMSMLPEQFASQARSTVQKDLDIRRDPSTGQEISVEMIANRGIRCRGLNANGKFAKFVKCSEALKRQLESEFGSEAFSGGSSKAPKSPKEYATGPNGQQVRIQYMRNRGWRCRGADDSDEAGQFIACPDGLREELRNRPPPAGMAPVGSSSRAAQSPRAMQSRAAQSPRAMQSSRAAQSPRAMQSRTAQSMASASSSGQTRLGGTSRLGGASRGAGARF